VAEAKGQDMILRPFKSEWKSLRGLVVYQAT
jgi:hypothetical protein